MRRGNEFSRFRGRDPCSASPPLATPYRQQEPIDSSPNRTDELAIRGLLLLLLLLLPPPTRRRRSETMELLGTVKDAAIRWVVEGILGSLFTEKMEAWSREVDLDGDVEKLKTAMRFVKNVVDAARGRKLQNEGLLLNLKQLLYDAEDVMDELDYYRLQREIEGGNGDGSAAGTHPMGDRASSSAWYSAARNVVKTIVDLANHRKRKREDDTLLAPESKHDVSQRINKIANQLRTAGDDVCRVLQLEISPTNTMLYQSLGEPRNTRLTTSIQVEPKVYGTR